MKKLGAIIVDDEVDAVKTLRGQIEKHCPDVEIMTEACSVADAITKLEKFVPDILFLDVELSDGTGFDILRGVPNKNFETIFVTAFNQYSIKAFKFSAIDYLLKPVDVDELCNAVSRIRNFRERYPSSPIRDYDAFFDNITSSTPKKFTLPTSEGFEYIDIDDVILIKADGSYSELLFINGKRKVVAKVLKDFQERLNDHGFFRPHNSYIVNLKHIKKFLRKDGGCLEMSDGSIVTISKRNLDLFKQIMSKYINIT
jgi:two-component system, LytTR family, response regulator